MPDEIRKSMRMSKAISEELATIARQLEEQLKFYRELGVADISGAARPAATAPRVDAMAEAIAEPVSNISTPVAEPVVSASAPIADSVIDESVQQPVQTTPLIKETMPKKKETVTQAGLFGDLTPPEDTAPRAKSVALPLLESHDSSLEAIREDIGECTRCKLHEQRTHIVFGEGHPQAKLVFVGEGPGADEDATGRPFVGRAGQLLDKIIAAIGLKREDVYIANVVKCRPPGNRTPERDEVATCEQFLFRQLAFIRPKVIVALGSPAFQCLLRTKETITRARGEWRDWNGIQVMPTFHPAYLLRSPDKKREAWADMKKVRDYLNSLPE
jgi:uracil-DNA glycosylase